MSASTIESKKVWLKTDRQTAFNYLTDLNNFKDLLPMDKISDWTSDQGSCSFKVQGTYKIGLELQEVEEPGKIILRSGKDSPFPFLLNVSLNDKDGGVEAGQVCEAQLNPFLKMMVEKPLKNLFDYIADKLAERYS